MMLAAEPMAVPSGTWLRAPLPRLSAAPTDRTTGQALLSGDTAHPGSETSTLGFNSAFFDWFRFTQRYQPTNAVNKRET